MSRVRAPELPQFSWLNSDRPLLLKELRGRIVILEFWTYGCINCLHTLPVLKSLEQEYQYSLTVIGVHSAKFDNEDTIDHIRQAVLRYDIEHPILIDRKFYVWQQYAVRAWPTLVVIDPQGYVIGSVAGEGNLDVLDQLVTRLIQEHQKKGTIHFQELSNLLEKQHKPLTTPLAFPAGILADQEYLFIADTGHHRLIVSTLDGVVLQVIGVGAGLRDGSFDEAQFFSPQGLAFDRPQQLLYVADTGNHALRRVNLQTKTVETIAGTGEQSHHLFPHAGVATSIALNSPWDLELVQSQLFIAMAGSHQIWQMQLDSGIVQTYVGTGAEACVDGSPTEAAFAQPSGMTTDGQELFVADSEGSSIRGVSLATVPMVRTVCGSGGLFSFGDVDGIGETARLQHCLGVEYSEGNLWVADTYNHKIKRVDIRTGECLTILGTGQSGADISPAQFAEPSALSATQSHLYVADTNNHAIRCVDLETLIVTPLPFSGLCAPEVCIP